MSRFAFAAALACAAAAHAAAHAEVRFFSAIEDVPLPPGFVERDAAPSFEGPGGRIVLAAAEGEAQGIVVRDFYYDSLPQLGWSVSPQPDEALVFQRGRERLSFTVQAEAGRTHLGVQLAVLPAATNAD